MNPIKIESGAVLALKNLIQYSDNMKDYINDNDKEPSWDGFIYLYKSEDMKVENIEYKVPVQIKGKNKEEWLRRSWISYPIEYKHLRNYYKDGGVFFVVVVISNDKMKTEIFYNSLTTVKLKNLLKNSEKKYADQSKNIPLQKLPSKDYKMLFNLLFQFGYDRGKQGSGEGEIIEKAISMDTLNKIDSIRVKSYLTTNLQDTLKKVSSGEICLYGHRSDIDMWVPFDCDSTKEIILKSITKMNKTIGIDEVEYYSEYYVECCNDQNPIIRLSENLTIDLLGGKFNFDMQGDLNSLIKDVDFLKKVSKGKSLWIGGNHIGEYKCADLPLELSKKFKMITEFKNAVDSMDFVCDKKFGDFSEENWISVTNIINLFQNKENLKENESRWYNWWWQGNVIPLLIMYDVSGERQVVNWISDERYILYDGEDEEKNLLPKGSMFKRDIWEKLYDVDEEILLRDIEKWSGTSETLDVMFRFFVEVLAAYDITKNEKYFDMAQLIISKLLDVDEKNEYGIINKLQLIKRKRELSEQEIDILEKMNEKTNDDMVKAAIDILLENKYSARKKISNLSDEKQELFKNYPIYSLL